MTAFVRAIAASEAAAASASDEAAWWAVAAPALARHVTAADYPLASARGHRRRRGAGRAHDPERSYEFGIERIADGVQAIADGRRSEA